MVLLIIAGLAAVLVVAILLLMLGRSRRPDESERFHRASDLTRSWAQAAPAPVAQPQVPDEPQD
jgi:hypothetical protein